MKVTEFAKKYDLPVTLVFNASFFTPTREEAGVRDIPERELYDAVEKALRKSISYHQQKVDENTVRLEYLRYRGDDNT